MRTLIILPRLQIENANAVAGLTWGFPAITHFLGFTHALSRKLSQTQRLTLGGCAVVCHDYQVHAYSSGREYQFALTRNPLTKEGKTAAFNEEGRMHLTVSLVMVCEGEIEGGTYGRKPLAQHLANLCLGMKLAGGTLVNKTLDISVVDFPASETELRSALWHLLPGFVLCDRTSLLEQHYRALRSEKPDVTMLDAWLDFSALKMQAVTPEADASAADMPAQWRYLPKPAAGWLVPLLVGYQRISPLYPPGQVLNARDAETPFAFTEAVYGVGEWCGVQRINELNSVIWRYQTSEKGYYCRSESDVVAHTSLRQG
ncbi:CRISPR-associated protein, Csy2 family [Izhakiella capsodis]|uniref:CRISPR-associated protein, Csy2 family n=1 Tax=Izhakiella capsodis TaxID=1367852 RepID=A0A1I4WUP4_9GAMM|nr:type I-F CRISPR-associated protein Csy2 [Izhakiella capsodis]SFN17207.1 CRISPR-associated protein, Csy2 family [Izhakiella capsodis]